MVLVVGCKAVGVVNGIAGVVIERIRGLGLGRYFVERLTRNGWKNVD